MRVKLTERELEKILKGRAAGRASRKVYRDSGAGPRGFVLRVSPTAATFYVVQRRRWYQVGDAESLDLEAARDAARSILGDLAKGIEPAAITKRREDKDRAKAAAVAAQVEKQQASEPTLAELVERSIKKKAPRLADRTRREWDRTLMRDLVPSAVGRTKASLVRRDALEDFLQELGTRVRVEKEPGAKGRGHRGGPHQADRALNLIRAAYRWALDEAEHETPDLEGIQRDPTRGIRKQATGTALVRERSLVSAAAAEREAFAEVIAFWQGVETLDLPTQTFARLILLCGTRHLETRSAEWKEFDLVGAPDEGAGPSWSIPREHRKGGREGLRVPLAPLAARLLKQLREARPKDARVFEVMNTAPGLAIKSATGIDVTLHDLRRTCGTALARLGVDEAGIDVVLGHTRGRGGTSTALKHYLASPRHEQHRRALELWAAKIEALLGAAPARVLPFAAAGA